LARKIKTVADLPERFFHLAVVQVGKTAVPILDGEIVVSENKKQMKDLNGEEVFYSEDTIVLLFQRNEESEIIK
jgi:hypothetical protein